MQYSKTYVSPLLYRNINDHKSVAYQPHNPNKVLSTYLAEKEEREMKNEEAENVQVYSDLLELPSVWNLSLPPFSFLSCRGTQGWDD